MAYFGLFWPILGYFGGISALGIWGVLFGSLEGSNFGAKWGYFGAKQGYFGANRPHFGWTTARQNGKKWYFSVIFGSLKGHHLTPYWLYQANKG